MTTQLGATFYETSMFINMFTKSHQPYFFKIHVNIILPFKIKYSERS
jgi:hypothetical protein